MEAYAKLVGRIGTNSDDETSNREFLVRELPCCLGRALSKDGGSIVIDSNDTLLSRQHVQIAWTLQSGWKLICLSKNGCTVDKKKYDKDGIAPLVNGSAIRIGNARLYFTLPIIEDVPVPTNRKRDRAGTVDDDDDGAIMMYLGGIEKKEEMSKITSFNSSDNRNKAVKGERYNRDSDATLVSAPDKHLSDKQAPIKGDSYLAMIESAFKCTDLLRFGDNSIHQTELVNWVSAIYVETLGEIQRQSVCKGVYNALVKNFEKVENEEEVGKPQKRGTIRWRRMPTRDIIEPPNNGPIIEVKTPEQSIIELFHN